MHVKSLWFWCIMYDDSWSIWQAQTWKQYMIHAVCEFKTQTISTVSISVLQYYYHGKVYNRWWSELRALSALLSKSSASALHRQLLKTTTGKRNNLQPCLYVTYSVMIHSDLMIQRCSEIPFGTKCFHFSITTERLAEKQTSVFLHWQTSVPDRQTEAGLTLQEF